MNKSPRVWECTILNHSHFDSTDVTLRDLLMGDDIYVECPWWRGGVSWMEVGLNFGKESKDAALE